VDYKRLVTLEARKKPKVIADLVGALGVLRHQKQDRLLPCLAEVLAEGAPAGNPGLDPLPVSVGGVRGWDLDRAADLTDPAP
jgi:hypothetical protein